MSFLNNVLKGIRIMKKSRYSILILTLALSMCFSVVFTSCYKSDMGMMEGADLYEPNDEGALIPPGTPVDTDSEDYGKFIENQFVRRWYNLFEPYI